MMTQYFQRYNDTLHSVISALEVVDLSGKNVDIEVAFESLCALSEAVRDAHAVKYFCGNGASAAFASHMAIDWSKNGKVPSRAFSDSALLTAVANDLGGIDIFSEPLDFYAKPGDLLVTISSSGNSPNILKALTKAREKSMKVVTFSGLRPDNASRTKGDLNFYVCAKTYGMVECAHQVLLHIWIDRFMKVAEWDRNTYQNMRRDAYVR